MRGRQVVIKGVEWRIATVIKYVDIATRNTWKRIAISGSNEFAAIDWKGQPTNFSDTSLAEEGCSDGDLLMIFDGDSKRDDD